MPLDLQSPTAVAERTWEPLEDSRKQESLLESFLTLWSMRTLTMTMVKRDFVGRYKGSFLGAIWPLLNPLGHMLLYTFLFGIILQVRFGGGTTGTSNFALYMMAGFLPYIAMSEAISNATTKILEEPNLVKRVVFPLQILPFVVALSSFMSGAISLAIVVAFAAVQLHTVHSTVLLLPLVIIPHFLFTVGFCWFISALGVFVRDCRHFMALALSAWMYATPIVYPAERLPENLQWILWVNPVAGIVQDYRHLILEGRMPELIPYLSYSLVAVVMFAIGFYFFYKTKQSFADVM